MSESTLRPWRVLREWMGFDNSPWLTLRAQEIETGNGQHMECYCLVDYPDWVNVVAISTDRKVILNREYRHGIGKVVVELPSGTIEPGESPELSAHRELEEETGYLFEKLELLCEYSPNPANHTNWVRGYLAIGGRKESQTRFDSTEQIEQVSVDLDSFVQMVHSGAFANGMHQATGWAALHRLKAMGWL